MDRCLSPPWHESVDAVHERALTRETLAQVAQILIPQPLAARAELGDLFTARAEPVVLEHQVKTAWRATSPAGRPVS